MSEDKIDQLVEELKIASEDFTDPEEDTDEQDTDNDSPESEDEQDAEIFYTGHREQDLPHLTANDIAYARSLQGY